VTDALERLIEQLDGYPHVLVTGPQRSGTRIASAILAHELGFDVVDEDEIEVGNLWRLFELYQQRSNIVVQAPGLSAYCHVVPDAIVFMRRPLEEIHASEARIEWPAKAVEVEQVRYFHTDMAPAELKYWAWENFQKPHFHFDWYELEHSALEGHPLWVEKNGRSEFDWNQTRQSGQGRR
jgi:hypothetical protein